MVRKKEVSGGGRPVVGTGVIELFAEGDEEIYRPYLLREATVHFALSKANVEGSRKVIRVNAILEKEIDWDETDIVEEQDLMEKPEEGRGFAELPGYAMNAKNYKAVEKDFSDALYREEREEILFCPALKVYGNMGESDGEFRLRISQEAREQRDASLAEIREDAAKKIRTLEGRLRAAEAKLSKEEAEARSAKMQAGISVLGSIMKSFFGRKVGSRSTSSSVTKATTAYKQHQDVAGAEDKVETLEEDIQLIQQATEAELAKVTASFDPSALMIEKEVLKPRRTDVKVERVALLWK